MAEENGVRITQAVIYETLMQLKTEVAILNDKIPSEIEKTDKEIADHEGRIRKLERMIWIATGSAGAVGSAITTFIANFQG